MGKVNNIKIAVKKPYSLYNLDSYIVEIYGFEPVWILGFDSVKDLLINSSRMMRKGDVINRYSLSFPDSSLTRDMIPVKQRNSLEKVVEEINNEEVKISESPYETQE